MHPDHRLPSGSSLIHSSGTRLGCFASTHAVFTHLDSVFGWNSRSHRKGRYPQVHSTAHQQARHLAPRLLPIWFGYPIRDISYWVALVFTLGCVAWVINGHYALYAQGHGAAAASSQQQAANVAAIAALFGGTLFEIGSWLLYWEALNPEPEVETGKVAAAAEDAAANGNNTATTKQMQLLPVGNMRPHLLQVAQQPQQQHKQQQQQWVQPKAAIAVLQGSSWTAMSDIEAPRNTSAAATAAAAAKGRGNIVSSDHTSLFSSSSSSDQATRVYVTSNSPDKDAPSTGKQQQQHKWRWFGLRLHDMGFMASFLQLIGATIFWVPCIFGTPGVYPPADDTNYKVWDGVYWLPQVVGATFFIISSILFMLEVQPAWYHPKPLNIGWHVGFWNFIGAVGFWLCGLFGFWEHAGEYQYSGMALSTFWGSYAFLIGSYLQLLEAMNKHPESLSIWKT